MLGDYICAVFPGTTLFTTDKLLIANGELWYSVQIKEPSTKNDTACSAGTTGWMVGTLKNGDEVIVAQEKDAQPAIGSARASGTTKPKPADLQDEAQPRWFIADYLLALLGVLASVILMTWERERRVSVAALCRPITIVEFVVLGIASVIALTMLIPLYFQIDPSSTTTRAIQRLTLWPGGHILFGFVMSAFLLKAVSFSESTG